MEKEREAINLINQFALDSSLDIIDVTSVSGGYTSPTFKVKTINDEFFVKLNYSDSAILSNEKNGIEELNKSGFLICPDIIYSNKNILVLKWIEGKKPTFKSYIDFAESLALHHKKQGPYIGYREDNYIGKNSQLNICKTTLSWADFFIEKRLLFQKELAIQNSSLNTKELKSLDELFILAQKELRVLEPSASFLHGDLWGGNHFMNGEGKIVLFDPAFYWGHREADLALMRLFGMWPKEFFQAYQRANPLEEGFERRFLYYQLYHALNHINLDKYSYRGLFENVLRACLVSNI